MNFAQSITGPWLVAGDFNEILIQNNKWGDSFINNTTFFDFWDCIYFCNLVDLGYSGSKYT